MWEAEFTTQRDRVEVHTWDRARTSTGVTVYASLGASAADVPGAGRGHRIEYLVGLEPGRDDVAGELASLALYARQEGVALGHGHTVGGDWPLWPGTSMTTFLIIGPALDVVPTLVLDGGLHVEFMQAIPIFETERSLTVEHGVDVLLETWERAQVPFWKPDRSAHPPTG